MKVELIHRTVGTGMFEGKTIDEVIVGQARVSSSRETNELFQEPEKLLRHCILNQHFSIFELANLGFRIETSRAMGRELLRHGKMTGLTEFSQRYSDDIDFEDIEFRRQATSNRQSSTDPLYTITSEDYKANSEAYEMYRMLINEDVARETARFYLPESTRTIIYMNFRLRELITFLNARLHKTAQKEIRMVAEEIKKVFIEECPIIAGTLFNFEHAEDIHVLEQIVLEKYKFRNQVIENLNK
jgi:flavin-dependent thymidylate synthase